MTNDKVIAKFKELSDVLKALQNSPEGNWYKEELDKILQLYRSVNSGVRETEYRKLRYQLDGIALGIVLNILKGE